MAIRKNSKEGGTNILPYPGWRQNMEMAFRSTIGLAIYCQTLQLFHNKRNLTNVNESKSVANNTSQVNSPVSYGEPHEYNKNGNSQTT